MIKGRFFNLANCISLARIPLAALSALMLAEGRRVETAVFMIMAVFTDAADGFVARKTGTVSDWGKLLDPAADKIAFAVMALTMVSLGVFPLWLLCILLGRDGLIVLGGLLMSSRARPPSANILGKASTVVLALYMVRQAVLPEFQLPVPDLLWGTDLLGLLAALLILLSFFVYVVIFFRMNGAVHAS